MERYEMDPFKDLRPPPAGAQIGTDSKHSHRAEKTRALLCEAAERIVAESGPAALTMRAVAARAGQRNTSAAIYHFGDAENLMWATIQRRARQMECERETLFNQAIADNKANDLATLLKCMGKPILSIVDGEGDHIFARFLLQIYITHHPYSELIREIITPELPIRSKIMTLLLERLRA